VSNYDNEAKSDLSALFHRPDANGHCSFPNIYFIFAA